MVKYVRYNLSSQSNFEKRFTLHWDESLIAQALLWIMIQDQVLSVTVSKQRIEVAHCGRVWRVWRGVAKCGESVAGCGESVAGCGKSVADCGKSVDKLW
jgi:hypothetical protein